MKTEFKTKFLQHLIDKKQDKGFTLIELLVVIIIIGILSAIALPSFLNQANKAKESEAKTYVGSMNRAQQAYYLEKTAFTSSVGTLGLGIQAETVNYKYSITTSDNGVGNIGSSTLDTLRSFIGGVGTGEVGDTSETTTLAKLCQENTASEDPPTLADNLTFSDTDGPDCNGTYSPL